MASGYTSAAQPYEPAGGSSQWSFTMAADAQQDARSQVNVTAPTLAGSPASPTYQWALVDPTGTNRVALFTGTSTNADPGAWTPDLPGNWVERVTVTVGSDSQSNSRVVQVGTDTGLTAIDLGAATEIDANSIMSASDNGDNTVDITISDTGTGGPDSGLDAPCLITAIPEWDVTKYAGLIAEITWDDTFSTRPGDSQANYMGAILMKGTSLASGDGHYAGVRLSNRMLSSGRLGSSRATYTNFGSVTVQRLTVIFEADEQNANKFQYVTPRMETSGLDDRQTGNATTWSNTLSSDLHLGIYFDIGAAFTGGYTVPNVSLQYALIPRT